jgi:hypothetical protein
MIRNTPPGPALVVLAAGMGSRFGGPKQFEAVGPRGATLMDYAIFDARRAGFGDILLVTRPGMDATLPIASRWSARIVHQRPDDLPEGTHLQAVRSKPWGTAHAVLAAARDIPGPFAVVNADDFYGAQAYQAVGRFLRAETATSPPCWAVAAYRLEDTVPTGAGVNRAVCRVEDGWLASLEEVTGIVPAPSGGFVGRGSQGAVTVPGEALVSMNMWAFTADVTLVLRRAFEAFIGRADLARDELLLPSVVQEAIARKQARVRVLDAGGQWFGMTHPDDRARVASALASLVAAGRYPERLW